MLGSFRENIKGAPKYETNIAILKRFPLLFAIVLSLSGKNSDNHRYRNSSNNDNYTGSDTEKKPWTNVHN